MNSPIDVYLGAYSQPAKLPSRTSSRAGGFSTLHIIHIILPAFHFDKTRVRTQRCNLPSPYRDVAKMPGILPMKVIKVGNSAQSRIAQACDRCRSKKIRCDGVRPTCSQCANVGFECRTSDKLSRRAFPRGYTESLEERVRHLETEVRELKDLLDEKDEKIDMLSAMHANHHRQPSPTSASNTLPSPDTSKDSPASTAKEDTFRVQGSPLLFGVENSDSYFMGPSSGRSFISTSTFQSWASL